MAKAQRLIALQGDMLDQLLAREAGLGPADLSRVRDANPGLAALEPILPLGTPVIVPATADTAATPTLPLIQLWS
ncbi:MULTISPECIES: tail protein X [Novosphingobium]|uniref:tail protein X n=1 Tax=Novosphingobium sp. RL4 TaxID=3109595 RepID=UPI002D796A2F|nr:tail protein X [Novosphingobium sp. RL4]WRT94304.1 tail protein X [Novosphingobium sp. RL4]